MFLVTADVAYGTGTVGFVFINDKLSGIVLVDTEGFRFLIVLSDKEAHALQRHVAFRTIFFQFLYGMRCQHHRGCIFYIVQIGGAAGRTGFLITEDNAAAIVTFSRTCHSVSPL